MTAGTTDIRNESSARTAAWIAAAIGAGVGTAALVYRRRQRSPWERARDRATELIETAREEAQPWMGIAAGAAAAGTAVALALRNRKETGWQRAGKRAADVATRVRTQATNPWASLGTAAAISLASIAYANRARGRTIRGIDAGTAHKINTITEKGLQVLRRVSEQTGKLYPRARRAMA